MKQIIVPVDFSEESLNAIELAIQISSRTGANIQMVYVVRRSTDFPLISREEEQNYAKGRFRELLGNYSHRLSSGVELTYIIKKGKIYDEVVGQAESFDDAVIVVSTHGASGFEEFFIGSNALKIITACELPVFAIKYGVIPKKIRKILLPIDYSMETRQKVPFTARLAKYFDARVHVMGVTTGNDQELVQRIKAWSHQVSDYLGENGLQSVVTLKRGDTIPGTIVDYAREENIDLISIMTEQEPVFKNFMIGSNAQQLISKSPVPVLCITPQDLQIRTGFAKYRGVPPA